MVDIFSDKKKLIQSRQDSVVIGKEFALKNQMNKTIYKNLFILTFLDFLIFSTIALICLFFFGYENWYEMVIKANSKVLSGSITKQNAQF